MSIKSFEPAAMISSLFITPSPRGVGVMGRGPGPGLNPKGLQSQTSPHQQELSPFQSGEGGQGFKVLNATTHWHSKLKHRL